MEEHKNEKTRLVEEHKNEKTRLVEEHKNEMTRLVEEHKNTSKSALFETDGYRNQVNEISMLFVWSRIDYESFLNRVSSFQIEDLLKKNKQLKSSMIEYRQAASRADREKV